MVLEASLWDSLVGGQRYSGSTMLRQNIVRDEKWEELSSLSPRFCSCAALRRGGLGRAGPPCLRMNTEMVF